jgi:hypothetical protein
VYTAHIRVSAAYRPPINPPFRMRVDDALRALSTIGIASAAVGV